MPIAVMFVPGQLPVTENGVTARRTDGNVSVKLNAVAVALALGNVAVKISFTGVATPLVTTILLAKDLLSAGIVGVAGAIVGNSISEAKHWPPMLPLL